jgi:hypothetical protein
MKYKIEDTVDAKGDAVTLWHGDYISQYKHVGALYYDAIAFLLRKGWAMSPYQTTMNNHKVIWAENADGEAMGGVVYEYHPNNKQGFIVIIFTADQFRGRHIYSLLQKALENEIIRLGGTSIASQAHVDNEARLIAGRREGMLPEYHRLYKDLTPVLDERKAEMAKRFNKPVDEVIQERWHGNVNPLWDRLTR